MSSLRNREQGTVRCFANENVFDEALRQSKLLKPVTDLTFENGCYARCYFHKGAAYKLCVNPCESVIEAAFISMADSRGLEVYRVEFFEFEFKDSYYDALVIESEILELTIPAYVFNAFYYAMDYIEDCLYTGTKPVFEEFMETVEEHHKYGKDFFEHFSMFPLTTDICQRNAGFRGDKIIIFDGMWPSGTKSYYPGDVTKYWQANKCPS
jgi:hypothetical protein